MYIVILAGGSGTRFWPLSRSRNPKQLMSILGGKSMLQRTVERILPLSPKRILVVTNALQAAETSLQLDRYRNEVCIDIVEEPVGRNTAPAIGLAARIIARQDPDGVMVVLPADHYIADEEEFRRTVSRGIAPVLDGCLVTMGIVPTRPETGYGYIEICPEMKGADPCPVRRFVEKPCLEKAMEFLDAGNFYWNSGMFMWRADVILERISEHMADLASALDLLSFSGDAWESSGLNPQIEAMYHRISAESIDYGVMEKADSVVVVRASFGWSDVGSWSALPEVIEPDSCGNVVINARDVVSFDSRGSVVYGDGKVVALVGIEDLVVVDSVDALMVCRMGRAQEVKRIVQELEKRGLHEYL